MEISGLSLGGLAANRGLLQMPEDCGCLGVLSTFLTPAVTTAIRPTRLPTYCWQTLMQETASARCWWTRSKVTGTGRDGRRDTSHNYPQDIRQNKPAMVDGESWMLMEGVLEEHTTPRKKPSVNFQ